MFYILVLKVNTVHIGTFFNSFHVLSFWSFPYLRHPRPHPPSHVVMHWYSLLSLSWCADLLKPYFLENQELEIFTLLRESVRGLILVHALTCWIGSTLTTTPCIIFYTQFPAQEKPRVMHFPNTDLLCTTPCIHYR